mmetsp:Transcript_9579/g.20755  ORF Transcript_9579/g.20755 Transcript_9579/m.20755 type:complete len:232 (-) Transcript_9579:195-890(-)
MMKISAYTLAIVLAASTANTSTAFTSPNTAIVSRPTEQCSAVFMSEEESAFVADVSADEADAAFDAVEKMGRGAAKTKRGKRKGGDASTATPTKAAATLAPEETFYEGPPAITETLAPTLSIVTVVGIVPAASAWARQAWVRYNITNRRIRVTSGIGGKDMAEIVYPDIVEIRTVKRLFGDGDMVFFLRDGAKFEMRNVPNFAETIEFVLGNCDDDVVKMYKAQGDVGADM